MNKSLINKLFGVTFNGLIIFVIIFTGLKSVEASSIDPSKPTALVTGSNRGIGLAFTKYYLEQGWNVIATARNPDNASELKALLTNYDNLIIEQLDVTDIQRIDKLGQFYSNTPIDLLINNAGVMGRLSEQSLEGLDYSTFEQVMAINVFGPLKMINAFLPSIEKSTQKKIVTMTSGASSMHNAPAGGGGVYYYRISKVGVNLGMWVAQSELKKKGIIVATIAPGGGRGVDTDMVRELLAEKNIKLEALPTHYTPAESVAEMARVISELDTSHDGLPLNADGSKLPR